MLPDSCIQLIRFFELSGAYTRCQNVSRLVPSICLTFIGLESYKHELSAETCHFYTSFHIQIEKHEVIVQSWYLVMTMKDCNFLTGVCCIEKLFFFFFLVALPS
jgi:hypothetical protein